MSDKPIAKKYAWKVALRPSCPLLLARPSGKRLDFEASSSRADSIAPQQTSTTVAYCSTSLPSWSVYNAPVGQAG
ncbi:hypothetical protein [Jatrophihabitans lederbergiae]|uniref:Uncharacterized protein n=1 Tax=Jatrophihabitans lederbergiae TaxID=3075547 RepID=A0ABU2JDM8_9ACTN|nr:hypothetical protein [Jatrophihabitans sp. DSM 44399]MDT0262579.1 hypothetical protein [Jatrophihabitans sp. DSM 44399]